MVTAIGIIVASSIVIVQLRQDIAQSERSIKEQAITNAVCAVSTHWDYHRRHVRRVDPDSNSSWRWHCRNYFEVGSNYASPEVPHSYLSRNNERGSGTNATSILAIDYPASPWSIPQRDVRGKHLPLILLTHSAKHDWATPGDVVFGIRRECQNDLTLNEFIRVEDEPILVGFADATTGWYSGTDLVALMNSVVAVAEKSRVSGTAIGVNESNPPRAE